MKIPIDIKSGEIQKKDVEKKNIIVGIDLGTTNSLVAYINEKGEAEAIKSKDGSTIVPSVIHFKEDGEVLIGHAAKEFLVTDPSNTIYSVKRLLGKSYKDLQKRNIKLGYEIIDSEDDYSLVKIKVRNKFYSPIELSSLILKELKNNAELELNTTISQAVITVPAYFNDAQRQATRDAGKLAGLDVLRIINEPTAASLSYGLGTSRNDKKNIAVYDLGGGTFDISILTLEEGIFEVLSTNGDTYLGGDDIDILIKEHWIEKYEIKISDLNDEQELRILSEEAKKILSLSDIFKIKWRGIELTLELNEFCELIKPLVERTISSCKQAVQDSKLKIEDIDSVVLVGGSTRIPYIKQRISEYFKKEAYDGLNPDEVVALGAAIQADILAGNRKDLLLLDITPLSLGIETVGGLMDVIIPRNTKIPSRVARQYTTSVDGQKNLAISIYQGERDLVQHNRKLGSFVLKNLPPMPAGMPKIEIAFLLDTDGVLIVRAKELRSNTSTEVEIKSAYGLSEEEMAKMLLESLKHAQSDMMIKSLLEAKNEANSIILATEKFITNNTEILSGEEIETLSLLKDELINAVKGEDKDMINGAIDKLNQYANPLAHRSMDKIISESMKGTKLS